MQPIEGYNQVNVNNNYISLGYILLAASIGLLNSFFYNNFAIMAALCAAEVICLLGCLLKKERITYICYYLLFVSFSMESGSFVGTSTFYGFKNFRIAGLNLAVWMLLPLLFEMILNYRYAFSRIGSLHKSIIRKLALFTLAGAIMGIFSFLSCDNGMGMVDGSGAQMFNRYYAYILPFLELLVFSWVISFHPEKLFMLKQFLYSTIVGLAIVFIACLIAKNYGNRGGLQSLQVSDIYFLLVSSFILVVFDQFNTKSKIVLGLSSVVILVLSLMFNASGKIVIMTMLTPILILIIMQRKKSAIKTIVGVFSAIILLIFIAEFLLPNLMKDSQLLTIKYQQVEQLFTLKGGDWFNRIPSSPKMRITEFLNIGHELLLKPWYLPFGKGFCGTIRDGLGLFTDLSEFAFSAWELQLGAYFSMHESINCFFLVGGAFGLYIIASIVIDLFKKLHKSPWLVFGLLWVLLFYNYHLTIAVYGIIALIVGLEDISLLEGKLIINADKII